MMLKIKKVSKFTAGRFNESDPKKNCDVTYWVVDGKRTHMITSSLAEYMAKGGKINSKMFLKAVQETEEGAAWLAAYKGIDEGIDINDDVNKSAPRRCSCSEKNSRRVDALQERIRECELILVQAESAYADHRGRLQHLESNHHGRLLDLENNKEQWRIEHSTTIEMILQTLENMGGRSKR